MKKYNKQKLAQITQEGHTVACLSCACFARQGNAPTSRQTGRQTGKETTEEPRPRKWRADRTTRMTSYEDRGDDGCSIPRVCFLIDADPG